MPPEENQKNTVEETPVSAPPKLEVVESVSVVEETPSPTETPTEEQITEPQIEQVEVEPKPASVENSGDVKQEETGSLHSVREDETVEEVPQIETPPITQTQEVEQPQTIEKIIYQTPPQDTSSEVNGQANLIQNLLNKARAKIQERKNKKLDKIMSLFESNSNISNSDVQELLRTTKRSATRYLDILEKQQKIIQVGNAGRGVKYIKKP